MLGKLWEVLEKEAGHEIGSKTFQKAMKLRRLSK
jgi:hypothetical protein